MEKFRRYGVYVVPGGALGGFGRDWLGWDLDAGLPVPHIAVEGLPKPLSDLTAIATPYGFHATIKPPFRLADRQTEADLRDAVAALAARHAPVRLDGLVLTDLDGFLVLTPLGDVPALHALAATAVRDLDAFRAPASKAELARRRAHGLSAAQEANLIQWGYPYVMEEFGFHITLTGRLSRPEAAQVRAVLTPLLAPLLAPLLPPVVPAPFVVDQLALVGQMENGRFRLIHRYPLSG